MGKARPAFASWLQNEVRRFDGNAVLMDTTTLHTVQALACDADFTITHLHVIDLVAFCRAALCADRVLYLASEEVDQSLFDSYFGKGVFVPLPVNLRESPATPSAGLRHVFDFARHQLRCLISVDARGSPVETVKHSTREALLSGWEAILGWKPELARMCGDDDEHQWFSRGSDLVKQLVEAVCHFGEIAAVWDLRQAREGYTDTVCECNQRGFFYQTLSQLMQVPYQPNTARLPIQEFLLRQSVEVDRALWAEKRIAELARQTIGPYGPLELEIPIFLAAVLNRMSERGDFLSVCSEARRQAAGYRKRRFDFETSLRSESRREVEKVVKALRQDGQSLAGRIGHVPLMAAVLAVTSSFAGGDVDILLAGLAVVCSVGKDIPTEIAENVSRRFFSPHIHFLARLSDDASSALDVGQRISQLWALEAEDSRRLKTGLRRMASAKAFGRAVLPATDQIT